MNCLILSKCILRFIESPIMEFIDDYVRFSKNYFLMKVRTKEDFCYGQIDFWMKFSLEVNFYQGGDSSLRDLNFYLKETLS